jgi:hypothetical protein
MKYLILKVLLIAGLLLSLYVSFMVYENRNKFLVGDCVEVVYETEFYRNVYYHMITRVGKKAYLTSIKKAGSNRFFKTDNFEWKFELNRYNKADGSNCETAPSP